MKNEQWIEVGTFRLSSWRRTSSKRSPVDILLMRLKELVPQAQSISEFGCSKDLNNLLEKEVRKWAKKHTLYRGNKLESVVALTMLDCSPCDISGIKGKTIFWRPLK